MPRKISIHQELPSYQVFWQRRGDRHTILLTELHDDRDVRSVLAMLRRHEEKHGKRCVENGNGGFTAYTGTIDDMVPRAVYWSELVMPDAEINSDNSPISEAVMIDIGIAMSWASAERRAKCEADAAGLTFEPGDGD